MERFRYEVDPQNRLVVVKTGLSGFRRVLDGEFRISGRNTLAYHIKAPIPQDSKAPHQVKLKGKWVLDKNHDLCFTLDKWKRQTYGDQLTIQGEIVGFKKNSLLFSVSSRSKENRLSLYILELSGVWQADSSNRLTFRINKEQGSFDVLTFEGIWQVGNNYEMVYRYEKVDLVRKRKRINTLVFRGYWDIKDKARLSYVLDKNSGSVFDFKTSLGIFKEDYIKYELGIGLSGRQIPVKRSVIFFGKWKIDKSKGLIFQVERQGKKIQSIVLGAEARLGDKGAVLFKLKNSLNKDLGAELELSRDIFQRDGQLFLRLLKSEGESSLLAGAGFRW